MRLYGPKDVDKTALRRARIAVLGYGSQGRAHALNLKDSGFDVVVGVRKGDSWNQAKKDGLTVLTPVDAVKGAKLIAILVPDTTQKALYAEIKDAIPQGATLLFAHGFNIRFGTITAPPGVDVSMVAPKAPGHRVRELFVDGMGTPGLMAVHQDAGGHAAANALAYAKAIGCTRAGVIQTTFTEETETDLFGEQVILCGGVSHLIESAFNTLVEAGYQPEIAYFECLHELKLIVDLIYQGGLNYMRYSVSDTAEHGDYTAGPKIVTDQTRQAMKAILADIQSGAYAEGWIDENAQGRPWFDQRRAEARDSRVEHVGRDLRRMMPWLNPKEV